MAQHRKEPKGLSGARKAATLMVSLGPEVAAHVYTFLSDSEIEQLTLAVANLGTVQPDQTAQVVEEFYHTCMAKQYIGSGGITTAREILEKAVGPGRAMEIIEGLQGMLQGTPFDFLKKVDPNHLFNFIQNEHPQTIAMILANLEYKQAADILSALPNDLQAEVALRIATMDRTTPEVVSEVERVLERKIAKVLSEEFTTVGGVEALAELLIHVDRTTERHIMEAVEDENQMLAVEIRKRMFTFDDIMTLDDRAIQSVLKEVDQKSLALALKGAGEGVSKKIYTNVSSRVADTLREEIEVMGPVRVKQVEDAQQAIVAIVRRLEDSGAIHVQRAGEDEYFS